MWVGVTDSPRYPEAMGVGSTSQRFGSGNLDFAHKFKNRVWPFPQKAKEESSVPQEQCIWMPVIIAGLLWNS